MRLEADISQGGDRTAGAGKCLLQALNLKDHLAPPDLGKPLFDRPRLAQIIRRLNVCQVRSPRTRSASPAGPLKKALNESILDSSERAAVKMRFSPCFKIND